MVKVQLQRDSNIELLRLLTMIMILVHHFIVHGFFSKDIIFEGNGELTYLSSIAIIINSFCYIGVNVFILITGYYGITFKIKKIISLYFIMVFYALIRTICESFYFDTQLDIASIKNIVFVFTRYSGFNWWFMNCYVLFIFIAPLINLKELTKDQFKKVLVLTCVMEFYIGYMQGFHNGYNIMQFVCLYVFGQYIRKFTTTETKNRAKFLLLWIMPIALYSCVSLLDHYIDIPKWNASAYNNPLLVLAAAGLLCYFLTFHFHSKIINKLALSSIAIYLLQDFYIFTPVIKSMGGEKLLADNVLFMIILLLVIATIFMMIAIGIDQIQIFINKHIMYIYDKINKRINENR